MSDRQVAADGAFGGKHEGTDDLSLRDKRRQEELMLVWSCEGLSINLLAVGVLGYLPLLLNGRARRRGRLCANFSPTAHTQHKVPPLPRANYLRAIPTTLSNLNPAETRP